MPLKKLTRDELDGYYQLTDPMWAGNAEALDQVARFAADLAGCDAAVVDEGNDFVSFWRAESEIIKPRKRHYDPGAPKKLKRKEP